MLAAMTKLETPSILTVMGLGLDGELTLQELKRKRACLFLNWSKMVFIRLL